MQVDTAGVRSKIHERLLGIDQNRFRQQLLSWYDVHDRALPWRVDWRKSLAPYPVWVSEIMLQQTVIKAVLPVYERFMRALPNITALARASEDEVRQLVRGLGYYRRFRHLHQAAQHICAGGAAKWPQSYHEWLALPGIGDYTASAISSITLGAAEAVVDGNVERVFCRLFDIQMPPNAPGLKPIFKTTGQELIARERPGDFNQAVMELGQLVCTPVKPRCEECPVSTHCLAYTRGTQAVAPQAKAKTARIDVHVQLLVPVAHGRVGLWRRPADAKFLRQQTGFLTFIKGADDRYRFDGANVPTSKIECGAGRVRYTHSITKHRIHAVADYIDASNLGEHPEITWVEPHLVEPKLVANLDRKAWQALRKDTAKTGAFGLPVSAADIRMARKNGSSRAGKPPAF